MGNYIARLSLQALALSQLANCAASNGTPRDILAALPRQVPAAQDPSSPVPGLLGSPAMDLVDSGSIPK